jgi:hypothetical protein
VIAPEQARHDFASGWAERHLMRLFLTSSALALGLLAAGASLAQEAPDGPLPTAGSTAGGAPTAAEPGRIVSTPAPARTQPPPLTDDLMAAADAGRRAPLLGEYHGSVGAMVGSGGLRGAYGHIVAHPSDHVAVDLRFSTLHAHGYPYGGYAYGAYPYGSGYGLGLGLSLGPNASRDERPYPGGWTTEVLAPEDDPPPPGH